MSEFKQLVVSMGALENTKAKKMEVLFKIFGFDVLGRFNGKEKLNTLDKFTKAVGYDVKNWDDVSDKYVNVYSLIKNSLFIHFDNSEKLFTITVENSFAMGSDETSDKKLEYKAKDVLVKFKNFLNKVYPTLDIYIKSVDKKIDIDSEYLNFVKNTMLTTETKYLRNMDFEARLVNPTLTKGEISGFVTELYLDICKAKNIKQDFANIRVYLSTCNCENCIDYHKKHKVTSKMVDIEFETLDDFKSVENGYTQLIL